MPRPRILVVDDEREIADFFVRYLTKRRYRTAWAHCGLTGLALAKVTRPDLVVLNYMMPGMSGLAVLKELRADPATAGIKVIMTSGHARIPELAAQAGAQAAIVYPVNLAEFGAKVDAVLGAS